MLKVANKTQIRFLLDKHTASFLLLVVRCAICLYHSVISNNGIHIHVVGDCSVHCIMLVRPLICTIYIFSLHTHDM